MKSLIVLLLCGLAPLAGALADTGMAPAIPEALLQQLISERMEEALSADPASRTQEPRGESSADDGVDAMAVNPRPADEAS